MKNTFTKAALLAALALVVTVGNGCRKDDMRIFKHDILEEPQTSAQQKAAPGAPDIANFNCKLDLRLIDISNAGVGAVNVTIERIMVHYFDERVGFRGWITLPVKPRLIDLLLYQQSPGLLLSTGTTLPIGVIDDIRVQFGGVNYIVWGDITGRHKADLTFPTKMDAAPEIGTRLEMTLKKKTVVTLTINPSNDILHEADNIYAFKPKFNLVDVRHEDLSIITQ